MRSIVFISIILLLACNSIIYSKYHSVTLNKKINKHDSVYTMCSSFSLKKEDVITYFISAKEVSKGDFNHNAILLPCSYYGTIMSDKMLLNWEIYAGGAAYLYSDMGKRTYLCKEKCCKEISYLC